MKNANEGFLGWGTSQLISRARERVELDSYIMIPKPLLPSANASLSETQAAGLSWYLWAVGVQAAALDSGMRPSMRVGEVSGWDDVGWTFYCGFL